METHKSMISLLRVGGGIAVCLLGLGTLAQFSPTFEAFFDQSYQLPDFEKI